MRIISRNIVILMALAVVSACGQKGNLYLPQQPQEMQSQEIDEIENNAARQ